MLTRTNEPKSGDPDYAGKKDKSLQFKITWLYGPTELFVNQTALAILNNYASEFDILRIRMKIGFDELVIPIFPYTRDRTQTIKKLIKNPRAHLLIVGSANDINDSKIARLYKNGKALYAHPQDERQFHINNMRVKSPLSWKEVNQARELWLEFLNENFNDVEEL